MLPSEGTVRALSFSQNQDGIRKTKRWETGALVIWWDEIWISMVQHDIKMGLTILMVQIVFSLNWYMTGWNVQFVNKKIMAVWTQTNNHKEGWQHCMHPICQSNTKLMQTNPSNHEHSRSLFLTLLLWLVVSTPRKNIIINWEYELPNWLEN